MGGINMKAISEVIHHGTPLAQAKKALIIMHGRGGTAKSMIDIADRLCTNDFYIAAPQGKNRIWYPYSFMAEERLNEPYLSRSVQEIKALIDLIAGTIPKEKIYIAGFSQGGCMSLEVTARFAEQYGGVIAFTGSLMGSVIDASKYHGDFKKTKVLITNGDNDPFIPLEKCKQSQNIFESLGADVTLQVYEGREHRVSDEEIALAKNQFL